MSKILIRKAYQGKDKVNQAFDTKILLPRVIPHSPCKHHTKGKIYEQKREDVWTLGTAIIELW